MLEQVARGRMCAMALALVPALALLAPAAAADGGPAPGAPGLGDRLFPNLGNGGYDVRR